jgi:hypothetical protein
MRIPAIPTRYAGVQFRSRLEARWAAFFDLCRFEWQYEPFDCDGYIPDFLLFGRVLLEVKPIVWGRPLHWEEPGSADAIEKLEQAFPDGRFEWLALVGCGIYLCKGPEQISDALIGRCAFVPTADRHRGWRWADFHLNWWPPNHELSLESQPILSSHWDCEPNLESMWREAGNLVQWKPSRARTHATIRHCVPPPPPQIVAPDEILHIHNARSILAEHPSGFCDRCGYPTGIEEPAEIDPDGDGHGIRHIDVQACEIHRSGEAP